MKQSIKLSLKAINKNAIKICNLQKQIQERSMKINDEPRANNEPTEEIIDMMNTADELLEKYDALLKEKKISTLSLILLMHINLIK